MASPPPLHGRTALLVLGVVFHAVYVLSIFDIYFKSPVVAHIESVHYAAPASSSSSSSLLLAPPAQRLVVFVADGCRADKFFEVNTTTTSDSEPEARVSFLRRMVETQGSWGVSHTRVPTESRPGHVALFAGMYEDVSAVTKGWQDNPVDFDSIFNQSRHAWLFGSPDIVPMFARSVPQATERHYSHEEEDFAKDASELDVWVYDQFAALFERAASDSVLEKKLRSPQLLFFCHFLGIDTNGHAHRPGSSDYLNNIALVDELVEKIYRLMEDFYDFDGKTAYVFSADHGMSNKGAHGDGDPSNTRTPLVAWGAGVDGPVNVAKTNADTKRTAFQIDLPTQSHAHVKAQLRAQQQQEAAAAREWGSLLNLARKDVMQADVAPLISSLLGLPYPRNSVGVLPFTYLAKGQYRAKAVMSNAQQLYLHARRKEQEKEAQTLLFFAPLRAFRDDVPRLTQQLAAAWTAQDFELVERLSQELIAVCLDALEYLQRYDWFFLLSVIVLGYLGWMLVLAVAFLHPTRFRLGLLVQKSDVRLWFLLFGVFTFLALESSPLTYFLYVTFPVVFWNFVWGHRQLLRVVDQGSGTKKATTTSSSTRWRHWGECGFVVLCLELVVLGFERRFIFGVVFSLLSVWPWLDTSFAESGEDETSSNSNKTTLGAWTASCLFISVFPYLPTEYGEHTLLVVAGGLALLAFALAVVLRSSSSSLNDSRVTKGKLSWMLAFAVVVASLVTMQWTMSYLEDKRKPPVLLTLANWVLSIAPIAVLLARLAFKAPLKSTGASGRESQGGEDNLNQQPKMLLRMVEIVLAVSPAYILLSISYEVFFFLALCCVLRSWIVLEAQLAATTTSGSTPSSTLRHEVRRAFFFLLLIKIAFFGTGNVASMSSFEISSTYRFVTVFAPFLMGALLVIKLLIPFLVVACAFHVVLELSQSNSLTQRHPPSRYFLLVVAMADFLALHFLFLVKNEGSWKEIGNSISMFGIVNALIVFVPLLFLLARLFVRDLLFEEVATDTRPKTQ